MFERVKSKIAPTFSGLDRTGELEPLVGTCDFLKVVSVIASGAFLFCGLSKDLFVPIGEQLKLMKVGESYIVYIFRNEKTDRVTGSSKLNKHLSDIAPDGLREGDPADLIIYSQTDMGYKAVVNGTSWGLLYKNEIFQDLHRGQKIQGYIQRIREDGRIDLSLNKPGFAGVSDLSEKIMNHLKASGGSVPLTDKTPPEEIYKLFGVSKKKFKMVVGDLYKKRMLVIEPTGLKLTAVFSAGKKKL